jgi:hypothetical protein
MREAYDLARRFGLGRLDTRRPISWPAATL